MHRYKELHVWQKAIDLAVEVYRITEKLPTEEKYGLISQMNKSAISIPSNIAEGAGRNGKKNLTISWGLPWVLLLNWILKSLFPTDWNMSAIMIFNTLKRNWNMFRI